MSYQTVQVLPGKIEQPQWIGSGWGALLAEGLNEDLCKQGLCRDEWSNGESHVTAWRKSSPPEEKNEYAVPETGPCLADSMDLEQMAQSEWCQGNHAQDMTQGSSSGYWNVLTANSLPMARGGLEQGNAMVLVMATGAAVSGSVCGMWDMGDKVESVVYGRTNGSTEWPWRRWGKL